MKNDNVKQTLGYTQNSAAVGAAIGSMLPVYVAAQSAAMNYINIFWVSILIGVIAVFLFALVVEYGMRTYFPYGMKGILSGNAFKKGWQSSALFIIITGLAALLMFSSGYMSFEGRKEAGKLAAGKIETNDIASISADISQNENSLLRVARSEKASIQKNIKLRVRDIENANPKLVDLKNEGNAWAANKLQKIKDNDAKLKRMDSDLQTASMTINQMLSKSNVSKAVEAVSAENSLKLDIWKERHETSKALVGWFGIVSIIIFAISSVVIVLYEIVHEDEGLIELSVSAPPPPPSELVPVSGATASLERKVDSALKQTFSNRQDIEEIKRSKPSGTDNDNRRETSEKRTDKRQDNGTDKAPRTAADASVRACKQCGTDITHKRSDAKFCTAKCRKKYHEEKNG
jgi:hypothetical protein